MMSLREEIKPYLTVGGYVSPFRVPPGTVRACDNHVMYTSEYYMFLALNGELTEQDKRDYSRLMNDCIDTELRRFPGDPERDLPDNYHGVLAARKLLELTNEIPISVPLRLWRLPQLVFMSQAHKYRCWKFWLWLPLLYTVGTLNESCRSAVRGNQDARRLAWHLIICVRGSSVWFDMPVFKWMARLYWAFGGKGMRGACEGYYPSDHPFLKYWPEL